MDTPLTGPVRRFVDDVAPELERIARGTVAGRAGQVTRDVAQEAYNLAAALIDVDDRHTDEELAAFVSTFAPYFDTSLQFATPADVRRAGLVEGRRRWLEQPSTLFEVLVADDRERGTTNCWRYYEAAMAVAHAVCALDAHPSRAELGAVDRLRSALLDGMARAGVPRPGTTAPPRTGAGAPGPAPAPPPVRPLDEVLAELDGLVGLEPVKAEVRLVADLIQVQALRRRRGMPVVEASHHLVFTGNPGTGKTTVARLLAEIYRTLEVVAKGHLVETDRSRLVAGYLGQTAIRVRQVVEEAMGGVLLVDEAYALARGGERDFGQEAIDTLVKLMEDHRNEVVVIAAGYPAEMEEFIASNPGLRSRFPKTVHFPDYSDEELVAIFTSMCARSGYACTVAAAEHLRRWFAGQPRDKGFGNARLARNLFEATVARHASRVVRLPDPTDQDLVELLPDDIAG